ncbi:MAG: TolC family protein [Elusimicrobia bacterium]|nr:TolC family protein [Elusimicrobiota bacterium]
MKKIAAIFFLCWASFAVAETVEDFIKLAISNNPELQILKEEINVSRQRLNQADALFRPKLLLGAYYDRYNLGYPSIFSSRVGSFDLMSAGKDIYGTRLFLSQPIYTGGKITAIKKQAKKGLVASEADFEAKKNEIIFGVKKNFIKAVYAKRIAEVLSNTLSQIEKLKSPLSSRNSAEDVLLKEKMENVVELSDTLAELNRIVSAGYITEDKLEGDVKLDGKIFEEKLAKFIILSRSLRPEIKGIKARENIDSLSMEIERKTKVTDVSFFSTYDYLHGSDGEEGWASNFQVGLSASFPLFDGGAQWAKYRQTQAMFRKTRIFVAMREDRIKSQVCNAFDKLKIRKDYYDSVLARKEVFQLPARASVKDILRWKDITVNYLKAERDLKLAAVHLQFCVGSEIEKY